MELSWAHLAAILGPSSGHVGSSWHPISFRRHLGASFHARRGPLGAVFWAFGEVKIELSPRLRVISVILYVVLSWIVPGGVLDLLGPSSGHLGPMLGLSWAHLGAIFGPSWGHLGAILGPSCDHLGAILGHFRATKGEGRRNTERKNR